MKNTLVIVALLISSVVAFGNKTAFKKIAEGAQVGNGHTTISTYNKKLTKPQIIALGFADLKSEYWENCGPWKKTSDRRPNIKQIQKLEEYDPEATTAKGLQQLYDNGEIVAIVGVQDNGEVECSNFWFNVYGKDGSVLKLRYMMGD